MVKPGEDCKKHRFIMFLNELAESRKIPVEQVDIKNEVGCTAGEIYKLLEGRKGVPLREIKEQLEPKRPLVKIAIGWLLREDKIEMRAKGDRVVVKLK